MFEPTLSARDIEHVKIGVFDGDGIMRGKYLAARNSSRRSTRISGSATSSSAGTRTINCRQHPLHGLAHRLSGCHGAIAAGHAARDSVRAEDNIIPGGVRRAGRSSLPARRAAARAGTGADMGYAVNAAAEFEFFLFQETPNSVREKGYRQLKTMTPGAFGYSLLRASVAFGALSRTAQYGPHHALSHRRAAHGNRTGRARGGAQLLRCARGRRSCGAVQRPSPRCWRNAMA